MKYLSKFKQTYKNKPINESNEGSSLINQYSPHGTYDCLIRERNIQGKFHIKFSMDMERIIQNIEDVAPIFYLNIELIPLTDIDIEKNENGTIDAGCIEMRCEKTFEIKIKSLKYSSGNYSILPDRRAMRLLKITLDKVFSTGSDYPCDDTEFNNIFEQIDAIITSEHDYGGLYGFYPEQLGEIFSDIKINSIGQYFNKPNSDITLTKNDFPTTSNLISTYS